MYQQADFLPSAIHAKTGVLCHDRQDLAEIVTDKA